MDKLLDKQIKKYLGDLETYPKQLKPFLEEINKTYNNPKELESVKILCEKERKYRAMFNSSPEAIIILDKKGTLVEVNNRMFDWLGYRPEDSIGKKLINLPFLTKASKTKVVKKFLLRMMGKKIPPYELEFVHKDGSKFIGRVYGKLIKNKKSGASQDLVLISDITQEKKIEEELKNNENKFRELFNNMSSCVAIYEATENGKDFIFKEFNRSAEKIDKIKKEKLIGKKVSEIFPSVKKFGLLKIFQEVYKTGKAQQFPISLYKDNRITGWRENYIYKLSTGEIVAIYKDITKQKQDEDQIKKLAAIAKYSKEMINMSDLDGNMIFLNEAGSKILGIDSDKVTQHKILEVIPEKWMDLVKKELFPTLLKGKTWEGNLAYKNIKTNKITPVYASTFTINDEKTGKPLILANISLDINKQLETETKLKSINKILEKKNEDLVKFNKLMVGRELKMAELKKKMEDLQK